MENIFNLSYFIGVYFLEMKCEPCFFFCNFRFECEIGGEFKCRATELILGMKGRGCIEYRVVPWDMCHFSKNDYEPAGPLYDIQTPKGEMYLLHLPHCETEGEKPDSCISAVHLSLYLQCRI